MLKQGVHTKIAQERLDHVSIQITLDTYSHVAPGFKRLPPQVSIRWYYPGVKNRLLKIISGKNTEAHVSIKDFWGIALKSVCHNRVVQIPTGRPFGTVLELLFEKKQFIPSLKQLLTSMKGRLTEQHRVQRPLDFLEQ